MKTPTNIQVQTSGIDSKKAAASWELDGARYHVWFDLKTKEIAADFRIGRNASEGTVYKNPLMEDRNHPDFFNTRKLDVSAHVGIIGQVFKEIEAKGLIAKALAAEEEKERQRQAESKEYRRQEKIKEAAPKLLALVKRWRDNEGQDGCCLPVTTFCQCKKCRTAALLRSLGEA